MLVRTQPLVSRRRGFTLIEAAMVTAIVGLGVVAMLQLIAAGTASNTSGTELTIGMNLARSVREMTLGLRFTDPTTPTRWGLDSGESIASMNVDDVNDLDGAELSPPVDARRQRINDMGTWQQSISVCSVSPEWLTLDNMSKGSTDAVRVTTRILHHGKEVCRLSWLVFRTIAS